MLSRPNEERIQQAESVRSAKRTIETLFVRAHEISGMDGVDVGVIVMKRPVLRLQDKPGLANKHCMSPHLAGVRLTQDRCYMPSPKESSSKVLRNAGRGPNAGESAGGKKRGHSAI